MPAPSRMLVFVSSTSDLKSERETVRDELTRRFSADLVKVYLNEDDVAVPDSPRKHLEDLLSNSEVYVGLFGARYGFVMPGTNPEQSVVEWEYETARSQERTYVLAFEKCVAVQQIEGRQAELLERIKDIDGQWVVPFGSLKELGRAVVKAYATWLTKFSLRYLTLKNAGEKDRNGDPKRKVQRRNIIAGSCAFALLAVGGLAYAGMITNTNALLLISVLVAIAIGGIILNDQ